MTGSSTETTEIEVKGNLVVSSIASIHRCVTAGVGVGWIDRELAARDVSDGHLIQLLDDWEMTPVDLHLVTASRWMPARLRALSDYLVEHW